MKTRTVNLNAKEKPLLAAALGLLLCGLTARTNAQTPTPPAKTDAASPASPQIDKGAMALLKRNQQAMFALKTYEVECHTTRTRPKIRPGFPHVEYEIATLAAQKPNKMRYDKWDLKQDNQPIADWTKPMQQAMDAVYRCDGTTFYQQIGSMYRASKLVAPKYIRSILEPWDGFYATENSPLGEVERERKENGLRVARSEGREDVAGVMCDKVFVEYETSYAGIPMNHQITWYFGPDGLTRRCIDRLDVNSDTGFTDDCVLVNMRLNAPIDAAQYAYTPSKNVKLFVDAPPAPLLANGTAAPNIMGQDKNNKPVKLSDLRGKVVVVDFWASWCLPCNAAMPHNQTVIKKLQAEGLPVVMLAVDNADTHAAFDSWIKRQSKDLPDLQFVFVPATEPLSSQYRAAVIPTQYVLDKNGVIRASFLGYEGSTAALETAIRAALAADTGKPTAGSAKTDDKKPLPADTGTKTAAVHDNRSL